MKKDVGLPTKLLFVEKWFMSYSFVIDLITFLNGLISQSEANFGKGTL